MKKYKNVICDWNSIVLKEKLGGGHFGDVYKATWHNTNVAVKRLKGQLYYSSDEGRNEFWDEVQVIAYVFRVQFFLSMIFFYFIFCIFHLF